MSTECQNVFAVTFLPHIATLKTGGSTLYRVRPSSLLWMDYATSEKKKKTSSLILTLILCKHTAHPSSGTFSILHLYISILSASSPPSQARHTFFLLPPLPVFLVVLFLQDFRLSMCCSSHLHHANSIDYCFNIRGAGESESKGQIEPCRRCPRRFHSRVATITREKMCRVCVRGASVCLARCPLTNQSLFELAEATLSSGMIHAIAGVYKPISFRCLS